MNGLSWYLLDYTFTTISLCENIVSHGISRISLVNRDMSVPHRSLYWFQGLNKLSFWRLTTLVVSGVGFAINSSCMVSLSIHISFLVVSWPCLVIELVSLMLIPHVYHRQVQISASAILWFVYQHTYFSSALMVDSNKVFLATPMVVYSNFDTLYSHSLVILLVN